jgi:hypothetical protein
MRFAFLPLAALLALAAGCGGGGSKTLSHGDFVKQANAICADYNKRIKALGQPNTISDLVTFSEKALPIAKEDVGKFKKLKPPKEDEAGWKAYGAQGDKVIDTIGKLHDEAKRNDAAGIQKLAAVAQKEAARSKRIAQDAGLAECAKD